MTISIITRTTIYIYIRISRTGSFQVSKISLPPSSSDIARIISMMNCSFICFFCSKCHCQKKQCMKERQNRKSKLLPFFMRCLTILYFQVSRLTIEPHPFVQTCSSAKSSLCPVPVTEEPVGSGCS